MEIFFKIVRVVGEGGGIDERRLAELIIVEWMSSIILACVKVTLQMGIWVFSELFSIFVWLDYIKN